MEANNPRNGELFITVQGFPMTFSLSPLCPERKEIQNIVEMWGGTVTGAVGGLHTIRLVDSQGSGHTISGSDDVFKLQYVRDCVEAQELLDLKKYRVKPSVYTDEVDVMDILLGNSSWKDAKRISKDKARRISHTGDNCDVFVSNSRCRQSYTLQEERAIVQYIKQECRFDDVKGKTLWVDMEQAKVCPGRSWGSMKEHFRKFIVHKIEQFIVDPLIIKKVNGIMSPSVSEMADMEEAKRTEDDILIQSELRAEKDVTEKFTDETHSCFADEKITQVDVHESELKMKNGSEQACSELHECENNENYEEAESIDLSVIKSSCTSILPENLVFAPVLGNHEVCIDKTRCMENCQVASANMSFKQGDEDELERTPEHLQNINFAKSVNENLPVVEVRKLPRSRSSSIELFDMDEITAKMEFLKAKDSEKLEFLNALELKKRNGKKKSEVQKRRLRSRFVENRSYKCSENLGGSELELKSLDKEKERYLQVMKRRNKVHGANILNISEQGEQSSVESQKNSKHAPQATHNNLPYENRGPIRLVHSKYFTRKNHYCEQSSIRGLKRLRNQIKDHVDMPDSEDSFYRYSLQHKHSRDAEIGVNISSSGSSGTPNTCRYGSQYTIREDIALLAFIQDCAGYEKVGGNQLWKMMEKSGKLKNRTWHSLKERYRKVIMQRLDTYENIESVREAVKRLRGKCKPEKVVKKEPDTRKPYSNKEDYLILKFIIENKRYSEVGAKSMWEQMSREQGLRERSWLSLKERFRKVIVRNLDTYKISFKAKYHFSKILGTKE
ncbi:uncharacterized protein LOC143029709 isoform X2 [Oratosquilla oratoria]|uniref:uncharacterized protein LOC143029709 isoform X2 n=1 Tax=Oratosquilla oratoria TaxID=337810 RepID=UPI003F76C455